MQIDPVSLVVKVLSKSTITETGCWQWNGAYGGPDKRPVMKISGNVKPVHRVVLQATLATVLQSNALHRCGNSACVNPSHLYEGTQADNYADAVRHGTLGRGYKSSAAKYTPNALLLLWFGRKKKIPTETLAQWFNISTRTLFNWCNTKEYKYGSN